MVRDQRAIGPMSWTFAAHRFLRIYPALAVNLLLIFGVGWLWLAAMPAVWFPHPTASQLALLGVGTSDFAGSEPGRVQNVEVSATLVDGVMIAPGGKLAVSAERRDFPARFGRRTMPTSRRLTGLKSAPIASKVTVSIRMDLFRKSYARW